MTKYIFTAHTHVLGANCGPGAARAFSRTELSHPQVQELLAKGVIIPAPVSDLAAEEVVEAAPVEEVVEAAPEPEAEAAPEEAEASDDSSNGGDDEQPTIYYSKDDLSELSTSALRDLASDYGVTSRSRKRLIDGVLSAQNA